MNYEHDYHAGNFADVFKHIVLIALLKSFHKKEKPFFYLETHGGAGLYDLSDVNPQKTHEFEGGIKKLLLAQNPPPLVQEYLKQVWSVNINKKLEYYPGSPIIAEKYLRSLDRMSVNELKESVALKLKDLFNKHPLVGIHHQNGYLTLKSQLPPIERRGLVLIDPPYESRQEFTDIITNLQIALKRFERGVYAIWYPIKVRAETVSFYRDIKNAFPETEILSLECQVGPISTLGLNACGMLIINPPWQCKEQLQPECEWLIQALGQKGERNYQAVLL